MSAAARVRAARNTIVAAWECGRSALGDPATEAAQALEDRGLLQAPEMAAELERLRQLVDAAPAELTEAHVEALEDAGCRALNDYYHERACSCDLWPESCHTDPAYAKGFWDTAAFGIGMAAVVGLWESLRTESESRELRRLRARVAELEAEQGNDDGVKAPWGRAEDGRPYLPEGAHWTDVPELVDRAVAGIQARVDQAQPGHWYTAPASETGLAPGTVRTRVDGYPRTVGQFANVLPADLELILHAHGDLSWCLEMLAKFRAPGVETSSQVLPLAVNVPVPVVLTEQDGPAVVTAAARAAVDKLRSALAPSLGGDLRG